MTGAIAITILSTINNVNANENRVAHYTLQNNGDS